MTSATFTGAYAEGRAKKARRHPRTPLLVKLGRVMGRRLPSYQAVKTNVMVTGGLGFMDYAAFEWHHIVGYLAIGASLLLLDYVSGEK